jgi:adenylosuccinate synthase
VRDTGREYGVTTGRPRRCGYLDLVALRYACLANSIDALVLTHLDVYDTLDTFEACVAYKLRGKMLEHFPASARPDRGRTGAAYLSAAGSAPQGGARLR